MKNIKIPENKSLEFYLQQEVILTNQCAEPCFFTWIVAPTVIFGKHQVKDQEINLAYCQEKNIHIVQRNSGGGCVFADEGNLMISFICPTIHSEQIFATLIRTLADGLLSLGYSAVTTDHNDILVNGLKVSGSACYIQNGHTIVHSTMLYNANFEMLQNALTPTKEKLAKHAVQSVQQRVANLVSINDLGDMNTFRLLLENYLIQCEPTL